MRKFQLSEDRKSLRVTCDLSDIKLSENEEGKSVGLVENAIYTGSFKHPQGDFEISSKTLDDFVINFEGNVLGIKPAINYNHNMYDKAAGWPVRMFKSESDQKLDDSGKTVKKASLNMEVEWTPAAKEAISNGEYKYFSIEFATEWTNSETQKKHKNVVTGGALTNKPFLKDTSVNLEEQEEETLTMGKQELITQLKDSFDINVNELQDKALKLKEVESKIKSLSEENASLKEEIALKEKEQLKAKVEVLLENCVREGKIVPAQKKVYEGHFLSLGIEAAEKEAEGMPKLVKLEAKGSSENEGEENLTIDQKIDKEAQRLLSEKKAETYAQAVALAEQDFFCKEAK